MLSTDRAEFESQLRKLCAGFDTPYTTDREEAYWSGLQQMSLLQFVRCVDEALGPNYLDAKDPATKRIPTTGSVWKLHRAARTRATQIAQPAPRLDARDHILFFANRLLLRHLINRGGLGSTGTFKPGYGMTNCEASDELLASRKFIRVLVAEFQSYTLEGDMDATPAAFIEQLIAGLTRIGPIDSRTLAGWQRQMQFPQAQQPFPTFMARPLQIESQQALVPA
jgi:hypothetical protein